MSLCRRCGRTWSQRDCRCKNHQYIEKLVGDSGGNSDSKELQLWQQGGVVARARLETTAATRAVVAREEAAMGGSGDWRQEAAVGSAREKGRSRLRLAEEEGRGQRQSTFGAANGAVVVDGSVHNSEWQRRQSRAAATATAEGCGSGDAMRVGYTRGSLMELSKQQLMSNTKRLRMARLL
ncbi:hypothetical protein B296_00009935 [Ensete ventricosum]|uniref:Uncharacterized protein n=1 Tax=Ensete ventricosum TaxID=4639 RepID=A0A427AH72_ENSVE|nr:hypothetical protein B296_00009935 [Ensete ventricosum]